MLELMIIAWLLCAPVTGFLVIRYAWKMDWTIQDLGMSVLMCFLGPLWGMLGFLFSPIADRPLIRRKGE